MPADLSRATALRLSTDAADVGLAVRGASCLALDELGCAGPSDGGVELVVDDMAARLGSDRSAYVFIELPADIDPGELAPFLVTIELAPP
jgi:hypothetical protein